jgi:uncharacterized protein
MVDESIPLQRGETIMANDTVKAGPSNFVWYDLTTTGAKAAETFYCGVVGWSAEAQQGGTPYTVLKVGETGVGGLMAMPPEFFSGGGKPGWMGYIGVDDVDVFTARVQEEGGKVHRAPQDIPGVGRFSVVADPQGSPFMLFQAKPVVQRTELPAGTPGGFNWRELHAVKWETAWEFYSGLFGWTKDMAVDMGPAGTYQTFAAGGVAIGGMMTAMDQTNRPGWLYYINVEEIEAAAARVTEYGGKVFQGPHEVPGGSWIVQGFDPQGGFFCLVGPKG